VILVNCNVHSIELIELLKNLKGYYGPTVRIYLCGGGDNLVATCWNYSFPARRMPVQLSFQL
jgi:hypothetical protein